VVSGIDLAEAQLRFARDVTTQEGVEITQFQGDMANLSPVATASQHVVFSACAFGKMDDHLFQVLPEAGMRPTSHLKPTDYHAQVIRMLPARLNAD